VLDLSCAVKKGWSLAGAISLRVLSRQGVPVPGVLYEVLEDDEHSIIGVIQKLSNDSSAVVVHIPDEVETITVRASVQNWTKVRSFGRDKVQFDFLSEINMDNKPSDKLTYWSFGVGVVFAFTLLILSSVFPEPSNAQRQIWQGILSVALAAFANGILGLLEVNLKLPKLGLSIRAIGAIAIAIIVFFFAPAFA
jgi:hypothetical protein